MKKIINYWVDKKNNKWSASLYSKAEKERCVEEKLSIDIDITNCFLLANKTVSNANKRNIFFCVYLKDNFFTIIKFEKIIDGYKFKVINSQSDDVFDRYFIEVEIDYFLGKHENVRVITRDEFMKEYEKFKKYYMEWEQLND